MIRTWKQGKGRERAHYQHAERTAKEEGGGDEVNMREEKRTVEKEGERTVGEEECRGIEKTDIGREDGEKCASERAEGK